MKNIVMKRNNYDWIWIVSSTLRYWAFSDLKKTEEFIQKNSLEGTATLYPLDVPVYDWAIKEEAFSVKKPHQQEAKFILNFSSASQPHFHFKNGSWNSTEAIDDKIECEYIVLQQVFCVMTRLGCFPSAVFSDKEKLNSWVRNLQSDPHIITVKVNSTSQL